MSWRDKYPVHPSAAVFPMMSDDELAVLGEDIKKNGLREKVTFWDTSDYVLLDGRNRIESMERVGIELTSESVHKIFDHSLDPVAYILSKNIHRRHLSSKQEQADLIVAAVNAAEKPRQRGEVSGLKLIDGKVWVTTECGIPQYETPFTTVEDLEATWSAAERKGGRGKKNKMKAKAVAAAKEQGISKRSVERAIAKSEGKTPRLPAPTKTGLAAARKHYLTLFAELGDVEAMDRERMRITDSLAEIMEKAQDA
jgi:hypothetical protein